MELDADSLSTFTGMACSEVSKNVSKRLLHTIIARFFFSSSSFFRGGHGHGGWSDNPQSALRPSYKVQPNALNNHVC